MFVVCIGAVDYTLGYVGEYVAFFTSVFCFQLRVLENRIVHVEDRILLLKFSTAPYNRDIIMYQPLLNVTFRDNISSKFIASAHYCIKKSF